MMDRLRRATSWTGTLVLLATLALAVVLVRWADREYLRVEAPNTAERLHTVSRPDWVWAMEHPYRRLGHDWVWLCVAANLVAAAVLATDCRIFSRRRLARLGTAVVLVSLLVGGVSVAQQLLVPPALGPSYGLSYSLLNALEPRLTGAILGVWVVFWLRPRRGRPDFRERIARLVGWMWMANVALLIGYGLLFG
jgi:hypothetical protein